MDLSKYLSEKMKIYDIPISMIKPYENNPRFNEEAVPGVIESIKLAGFKVPIVLDHDLVVVTGHTRLKAVTKMGWKTVPCIYADDLSESEVAAFRLADNKVAETATWNEQGLLKELQRIADDDDPINMMKFGFESVEDMLARLAGDEEAADLSELADDDVDLNELLDKEPRIKKGEIWQIGKHRIMCGDSTNADDVKKLMGGETASALVTDPPYGVSYVGGTADAMTIENDNLEGEDFVEFLVKAFSNASSVLKPGGAFYIWHADSKGYEFRLAVKRADWIIRECLIWVKNSMVLGRQDYQWKHEPCLYGWKDGAPHTWNSDRSQTTVLEYDKPSRNDIHPTMKPVPLFEYQVRNSTHKGDNVLDLFAGSGTLGVACEHSGRVAFMMEYDPKYAEAAISRLEEATGATAAKISD